MSKSPKSAPIVEWPLHVLPYTWKNNYVYLITSFLHTTESDIHITLSVREDIDLFCGTLLVSRTKLLHFLPSHSPGCSSTISWQGCQMVFSMLPHNSHACKCVVQRAVWNSSLWEKTTNTCTAFEEVMHMPSCNLSVSLRLYLMKEYLLVVTSSQPMLNKSWKWSWTNSIWTEFHLNKQKWW